MYFKLGKNLCGRYDHGFYDISCPAFIDQVRVVLVMRVRRSGRTTGSDVVVMRSPGKTTQSLSSKCEFQ